MKYHNLIKFNNDKESYDDERAFYKNYYKTIKLRDEIKEMTFQRENYYSKCPVSLYNLFESLHYSGTKNKYVLYDTDDEHIDFVIRVSVFIHKMFILRKTWANVSRLGSQSENFEEIITLSKLMIEHCEEQIENLEEDYDE